MKTQYKHSEFVGLLLILFLSANSIQGQNKHVISVNYGFGRNMMLINGFEKEKGFSNDGFYNIGIHYQRNLSETFALKTGLNFRRNDIMVAAGYNPYSSRSGESSWDIQMLSLPLFVNYKPFKYVFIEGGPLVDLQFNKWESTPIDTQSGIGIGANIGGIYKYKNINFTLSPFINYHAIIQFDPYERERLVEIGVSFGIGYQF